MVNELKKQIEIVNEYYLKQFQTTDFIESLSSGTMDSERFKEWINNIYPTVILFTDSLESNTQRVAEAAKVADKSKPLLNKMQHQLVEEREHNRIWERFMTSIGLDYTKLDRGYVPNGSMNILNNWIWAVNSNPVYSVEEGIAAIYGIESILLPLCINSLDGINKIAKTCSPNADTRWFEIHTEGEEIEHARQGLAFLGSYNGNPLEKRIKNSIEKTHKYFLSTCITS